MISLASSLIGAGHATLVVARFVAPVLPGERIDFIRTHPEHMQVTVHRGTTLIAELRWRT